MSDPWYSTNRDFLENSDLLRYKLGRVQSGRATPDLPPNTEDVKYQSFGFNGSFHKGLQHNNLGSLVNPSHYVLMRMALQSNNQSRLANVPMAAGYQMKLVDPWASLSTPLVGTPQWKVPVDIPPTLSSKESSAMMAELYAMVLSRDQPFFNNGANATALTIMNDPQVIANLPHYSPIGVNFTAQTLFRGMSASEKFGPYISQLLLLNIPMGGMTVEQKYNAQPTKQMAIAEGKTVEWGRNNTEMVAMQNTTLNLLPPANTVMQKRYIHTGRSLAEAVHIDPVYQFFYQASLILLGLGVPMNPGMPSYANQASFITGASGPSVQCSIAEVTGLALKHAWFWKWQVFRGLRPEVYSLWVDNVLNARVANAGNYDIDSILLNSAAINAIKAYNQSWGFADSYTLPTTYREGSPIHPDWPSGHATVAGAAITIMKIFFNATGLWSSLPGLQPGNINRTIVPLSVSGIYAQASTNGGILIDYSLGDASSMTINGELNKLASNVAFGRDFAGIHYRSSAVGGILLGEKVAIGYMEDQLSSMVQNGVGGTKPSITIQGYLGNTIVIVPSIYKPL